MADARVRIRVSGKDEGGSRVLGQVQRDLAKLRGDAAFVRNLLGGFGTVVAVQALARQVSQVVTQFSALAERGGQVVTVTRAFSRVTGDTAGAIRDLRGATQNLVTDYDLMVGLNKALTLGSAANVEQFGELARTALALGRALGVDAGFALESLSLGIGRQSRLILDNLGLIVSVEDANKKYAKTLGKSTAALTEDEQRIAFRNAALDSARKKVADLGGVELDAADAVKQAGVAIKNFKDDLARLVATSPRVQAFFTALADAVRGFAATVTEGSRADIMRAMEALGVIAGNAFSLGFLVAVKAALPDFLEFRLGRAIETHVERIRGAVRDLAAGPATAPPAVTGSAALDAIRRERRVMAGAHRVPVTPTTPPAEPVDPAERLKALTAGAGLGLLNRGELAEVLAFQVQFTRLLRDGNAALKDRVAAAEALRNLSGVTAIPKTGTVVPIGQPIGLRGSGLFQQGQAGALGGAGFEALKVKQEPGPEGQPGVGFFGQLGFALREATDAGQGLSTLMADMTTRVIGGFGDAVSSAFEAFVTGSQSAGAAFKQAMLGALSAVARGFGDFFAAKAVAALAEGLLGNPAAFKAAGLYTAAATAMYALSGAIGGAARGGAGGGVGSGARETSDALRDADRAAGTIVVQGGILDMSDPRQARAFADAVETMTGRKVIFQGA
jgi:hypothetical protein